MDYNFVLDVQSMACDARNLSDRLFNRWYNGIENKTDEMTYIFTKTTKNELIELRNGLDRLINSI